MMMAAITATIRWMKIPYLCHLAHMLSDVASIELPCLVVLVSLVVLVIVVMFGVIRRVMMVTVIARVRMKMKAGSRLRLGEFQTIHPQTNNKQVREEKN